MQYQGASSAREALHAFLQVPKIERAQSLGVRIRCLAPAHTHPAPRFSLIPPRIPAGANCATARPVPFWALCFLRRARMRRCRMFRPSCVLVADKWERRVSGNWNGGNGSKAEIPAQIHPLDFQIGHAEAPSLLLSEFANRWQHFPHKVRRP